MDNHTRQLSKDWLEENRCCFAFVGDGSKRSFMINPNSILSKILAFNDPSLSLVQHVDGRLISTYPHVAALTSTILVLMRSKKLFELKLVLLARANSLYELGSYESCQRDLEYILQRLDASCVEARQMIAQVDNVLNRMHL